MDIPALAQAYNREGYIGGVPILSADQAAAHRASMEAAEEQIGSLHYRSKAHTILTSPLQLATDSTVLDIVESLIGPEFQKIGIIVPMMNATRKLEKFLATCEG